MRTIARFQVSTARSFAVVLTLSLVSVGWTRSAELIDAPAARDVIVLFPSNASQSNDGKHWSVTVQGRVYQPAGVSKKRTVLINAIAKVFDLDDNQVKSSLFEERAGYLLSISEPNRRVTVKIGDHTFRLPPSNSGGYFTDEIQLDQDEISRLARDGVISFETVPTAANSSRVTGSAILAPEVGLSVVTDMDDTIKVTDVLHHTEMLKNTLVRTFSAVTGMVPLYQSWQKAAKDQILFHVVSAGPWQMYEPLRHFTEDAKFPGFAWYMRPALKPRTWQELLHELKPDPYPFKVHTIEGIMKRFPRRHFIFVGDSGEKDPEVYSTLLAEYPTQVDAVFIRNVTKEPRDAVRYKNDFRGDAAAKLWVFNNPAELSLLSSIGVVL